MKNKNYVTTGEAARILGVSTEWVRELERRGELSAIAIDGSKIQWRAFPRADVERLAREREKPEAV